MNLVFIRLIPTMHSMDFSKLYTAFAVAILILLEITTNVNSQEAIATIAQGALRGNINTSRGGKSYYEFRAVPYGKVEKRFQMSKPADGWTGVRNATKSSPGCLRWSSVEVKGVEDCLDVDIYTPRLPTDSNFEGEIPVMVWISGGGYVDEGVDGYDGNYLMDHEVVLVNINYRVGALGFLNLNISEARGNQGLKDMVLALTWVKQNIAAFGGDSKTVAVFGESSGGVSGSLLTLSPMASSLFQSVIMESGTALCLYVFNKNIPGIDNARGLAAKIDCPTRDPEALLECLQNADPNIFVPLTSGLSDIQFDPSLPNFGPTFETYSDGVGDPNVFIKENPLILAERGDFNKVPMIIGKIAAEGASTMRTFVNVPEIRDMINNEWGRQLALLMMYTETAPDPCKVTAEFTSFYLNGRNLSEETREAFQRGTDDRMMLRCVTKMANAYSKYVPVYMYNFTKEVPEMDTDGSVIDNLEKIREKTMSFNQSMRESGHGDEMQYHFKFPTALAPNIPADGGSEYEFSENFIKLWTSFVKNGKPGPLWGTTEEWSPIDPLSLDTQKWLQLDEKVYMKSVDEDHLNRMKFWNRMPINEVGQDGYNATEISSNENLKKMSKTFFYNP